MTGAGTGSGRDEPPPGAGRADPEALRLDLDGYEGPIDVLLTLARAQKVDLARISILDLADQYLTFIGAARRIDLGLAAEYLVMAAWLVYLKSRLLLPDDDDDEGPSGPELAEALSYQLRRLEAVQDSGRRLMARPRLGRDVFARGDPEGLAIVRTTTFKVSLFDLLSAYGANRRHRVEVLRVPHDALHGMADALARLSRMAGTGMGWRSLARCLPPDPGDGLVFRSAVAATFAAGLELARRGLIEIRQPRRFGPIHLRARDAAEPSDRGP